MPIRLDLLYGQQKMEVSVNGPGKATRLFIFSGTVALEFRSESGVPANKWSVEPVTFNVRERTFNPEQFIQAIAVVSLASIEGDSGMCGWAVDEVEAFRNPDSGNISVRARLGVRGASTVLYRLAYQVNVLAAL